MTKNVNFSSTTAIFYTYTLDEYPGRIPDPPLGLTFNDAMELLQLRSIFPKASEQLEAVRSKLEAEQAQDAFNGFPPMDLSLTKAQDVATCSETSDSRDDESDESDVLCRKRTLENFDDASMKHKTYDTVELVAELTTPPASPLSPSRENAHVSINTQVSTPTQVETSPCSAIALHPSPPASPFPSTAYNWSAFNSDSNMLNKANCFNHSHTHTVAHPTTSLGAW